VAPTLDLMSLNPTSTSPGHTARLVAATGVPLNKRVLAYHEAPPAASDTTLTKQRENARPLYSRPGALPSSLGAVTNRSRKIATQPERVLDAPGMVNNFYLNLLSWSVHGVGNVATGSLTDELVREHWMTLDEAHLILNTKHEEGLEQILKVRWDLLYCRPALTSCDHQGYKRLFRANAPPEVPLPTSAPVGRGAAVIPRHPHYLQSRVARVWERVEAEQEMAREESRNHLSAPPCRNAYAPPMCY
jgi:hypothetical protein